MAERITEREYREGLHQASKEMAFKLGRVARRQRLSKRRNPFSSAPDLFPVPLGSYWNQGWQMEDERIQAEADRAEVSTAIDRATAKV